MPVSVSVIVPGALWPRDMFTAVQVCAGRVLQGQGRKALFLSRPTRTSALISDPELLSSSIRGGEGLMAFDVTKHSHRKDRIQAVP